MLRMRDFIATNIAAVVFLSCYFLTVVLGNIIYATPLAASMLTSAGFGLDLLYFPTSFTSGFWILLLLPFIAIPVLAPLLRVPLKRIVVPIVKLVPNFGKIEYAILLAAIYGIIGWTFWHTNIFGLIDRAADAREAIEARFALQSAMSFREQIVVYSILPFMASYSFVAAIKGDGKFWVLMTVINIILTTVILVAINMKWPILVFYIGLVAAIFVFSRKYAYLKAIVGVVILVVFYLAVSSYVFRWGPTADSIPSRPDSAVSSTTNGSQLDGVIQKTKKSVTSIAAHSLANAPFLFAELVDRMAVAYPYYYKVFTEEGQICGSILDQVIPGPKKCAPTYVVYTRIFGKDGYEGRGTAPAAPQITSYAFGGWPGAFLAMLGTCVVLAAFAVIPLHGGAMAGAWTTVGATVGYHLSQLPGEGPIIYNHGLLWPLLFVGAYAILRRLFLAAFARRQTTRSVGDAEDVAR